MPHIFFLSYASENWNQPGLEEFYNDLCQAIAPFTRWKYDDDNISFRDHKMRLGEQWKPAIANALQESAVLVCVVSEAYCSKQFCGQEVFIFDKRRQQGLAEGEKAPEVILPVIWAPVEQGYPKIMADLQADQAGMPKDYFRRGLFRLKTLDNGAYKECVAGFADAIQETWKKYSLNDAFDPNGWKCTIPPGPAMPLGPSIPNKFALGDWEEAAGPEGWLKGPEVANFVFAAGVKELIKINKVRYGERSGQWLPYLPPSLTTISQYAVQAVRKRRPFKFREIPVTPEIVEQLEGAKERKNLTVVVADPQSLTLEALRKVHKHDELAWEGTAVLLPCDDANTWESQAVQDELQRAFPRHILIAGTSYPGRIASADELERRLDMTLGELYSAVIKTVTKGLPVTDVAPTQLATNSGISGI
jgi:FxsC-like protein